MTTQPRSEPSITSQCEPTTQVQRKVVNNERVKERGTAQQVKKSSSKATPAVTDSVGIIDSDDQILKPGDGVRIGSIAYGLYSIYIGYGYVVRYDRSSMTLVEEKLDMTRLFYKNNPYSIGNVNEFHPKQRVQRALQHVGRPCPVRGGSQTDFIYWTFFGLSFMQRLSMELTPDLNVQVFD